MYKFLSKNIGLTLYFQHISNQRISWCWSWIRKNKKILGGRFTQQFLTLTWALAHFCWKKWLTLYLLRLWDCVGLPTGQAGASLDLVVGWSDGPPATLYPIPSPGLCAWQMPTWMDSRGCPSHHWALQKAAIWSFPEETQQIIFCYHSFIHKCTRGYLCIPI